MILEILPLNNLNLNLFYSNENIQDIDWFDIVVINFKNKEINGLVLKIFKDNDIKLNFELKEILFIKHKCFLSKENVNFLEQFSRYNAIKFHKVLSDLIPVNLMINEKSINQIGNSLDNLKLLQLNGFQNEIFLKLNNKIANNCFNSNLLHGITGSGKTAIYLNLIIEKLKNGKQILILIPQIGLVEQIAKKIESMINLKPLIWHSGARISEKKKLIGFIKSKEPAIFLGSRSVLTLPYKNLGLIIIDEEHDESYKQNEFPVYNARDMGILLAQSLDVPILLCSATPSLESYLNCYLNKSERFILNKRFYEDSLDPEIKILKHFLSESNIFHEDSINRIKENIEKNRQSLIFINKRGYSKTIYCKECKRSPSCNNCTNFLTYHKKINSLKCHYCGHREKFSEKCNYQDCKSKNINEYGYPGVEKIEEELKDKFPNIRTVIFSSDTIKNREFFEEAVKKIENNEIDVIIGTAIISKGYHFPSLNFVCVVDDGNNAISEGDIRGNEKLFQLITQIKGRAGREKDESFIYIQTANPTSKILQYIKENKIEEFYQEEILIRKNANLPPFYTMISILISSEKQNLANEKSKEVKFFLDKNTKSLSENIRILGPAESFLHYTKKQFRYRILIKFFKNNALSNKIKDILSQIESTTKIQVKIDVDPYSFL